MAFLFGEPLAETGCVIPVYKNNGVIVFLRETRFSAEPAVIGIELLVLCVGYFARAGIKRFGYLDAMGRLLIEVAIGPPRLPCHIRGDWPVLETHRKVA